MLAQHNPKVRVNYVVPKFNGDGYRGHLQKVIVNLDGGASQERARRVPEENLDESALLCQARTEYRRKRGSPSVEETNHHRQITSFFFLLNKSDVNPLPQLQ